MNIFNFFNKNKRIKESMEEEKMKIENIDYSNIIEITKILTNDDVQIVSDMTLLVNNSDEFLKKYESWCLDIGYDFIQKDDILIILAYWLVGYNTSYEGHYGCYIDWKEATCDILAWMPDMIENLGFPLSVDDIKFTDEEFTDEALELINIHFKKSGYTLVTLDTDSDSYHLFISTLDNLKKLVDLGKNIGFKFNNNYLS